MTAEVDHETLILPRRSPACFVVLTLFLCIAIGHAQQGRRGVGPDTLPDEPQLLGFGNERVRVVSVKGFFRPSAVDILPNGDLPVAERNGALRVIRDVLDPTADREHASRACRLRRQVWPAGCGGTSGVR